MIQIELLGRFRVTFADKSALPILIRGRGARALLAYLALHAGQEVPRARLAALLWEDEPESVARHNLRQTLSELRAATDKWIDIKAGKESLLLDNTNLRTDVADFLARCDSPTLANLEAAAALYIGDLTSDFEFKSAAFEEWVNTERRRLHARALDAFDLCIRQLNEKGRQRDALHVCERLLVLDPLRERTHQLLISLENDLNGRSSALTRAGVLASLLHEQLGVLPEQATKQLVASLSNEKAGGNANAEAAFRTRPARLWPQPARAAAAGIALLCTGALTLSIAHYSGTGSLRSHDQVKEDSRIKYPVAVLPFVARTVNPELIRILQTLEIDLVDSLSHTPGFTTISQQTMRRYAHSTQDAQSIGKELDVRFILSANGFVEDGKVVIRLRMIDTRSGEQIWFSRVDREINASDGILEEVALGLSRQLQVNINIAEGLRIAQQEGNDKHHGDLIKQGYAEMFLAGRTASSDEKALSLLEKALALKPDSVSAKVGIGRILALRVFGLRSDNPGRDIARAELLLSQSIEAATDSSPARYFLGVIRKAQGRIDESIALFREALKLNPSNANAHAQLGHALIYLGRAHETEEHIKKAIRLSPQDEGLASWLVMAGQAKLHLEKYDEAAAWFDQALAARPTLMNGLALQAAALALKGNTIEAAGSIKKIKASVPDFSPTRLPLLHNGSSHPLFTAQRDKIVAAILSAMEIETMISARTH
jgi:DNA-binding SARP family transcriptional activator/TolB-like protein